MLAFSFSGTFIESGSGVLVDLGGECATLSNLVSSLQRQSFTQQRLDPRYHQIHLSILSVYQVLPLFIGPMFT